MFTYKTYCYIDGKLAWMTSSVKGFDTREAAIEAARTMARCAVPLNNGGEYQETEDGAKLWFKGDDGERVHRIYKA